MRENTSSLFYVFSFGRRVGGWAGGDLLLNCVKGILEVWSTISSNDRSTLKISKHGGHYRGIHNRQDGMMKSIHEKLPILSINTSLFIVAYSTALGYHYPNILKPTIANDSQKMTNNIQQQPSLYTSSWLLLVTPSFFHYHFTIITLASFWLCHQTIIIQLWSSRLAISIPAFSSHHCTKYQFDFWCLLV